ncbi:hypothetical protein FG379_002997 [Cryptosporidium bovis]|uniref:uncharacterized protein n=1 Tax=Cryptosporidium bovis TaxID=310047 RepID=UPI00351A129B|nr:hypothetical protein FG379_002997 [Cryptosporidium bovis]
MPELSNTNKEIIFNSSKKKTLNDIFKTWRNKLYKVIQSRPKRNQLNESNEVVTDDNDKYVSSQIVHLKVLNYPNYDLPERCSDNFFSRNPFGSGNCSNLQLSLLGPALRRKNKQFSKGDELEDICKSQVNRMSSKNLLENIEFARKLSEERINRARNYYKKLQAHVRSDALNEVVEYIFNDFDENDLTILLKHSFDTKCNNTSELELSEVYLKASSKIDNSHEVNSNTTITKDCSENDYSFTENFRMPQIMNSSDGTSELPLVDYDTVINNSLLLLESDFSNLNTASDYLVSRISSVSLEINKTIASCIEKKIINIKTGKYQGNVEF